MALLSVKWHLYKDESSLKETEKEKVRIWIECREAEKEVFTGRRRQTNVTHLTCRGM